MKILRTLPSLSQDLSQICTQIYKCLLNCTPGLHSQAKGQESFHGSEAWDGANKEENEEKEKILLNLRGIITEMLYKTDDEF